MDWLTSLIYSGSIWKYLLGKLSSLSYYNHLYQDTSYFFRILTPKKLKAMVFTHSLLTRIADWFPYPNQVNFCVYLSSSQKRMAWLFITHQYSISTVNYFHSLSLHVLQYNNSIKNFCSSLSL